MSKDLRNKFRAIRRRLKGMTPSLVGFVIIFGVSFLVYAGYMADKRFSVDPSTYRPLLHLIARAESNDNYNAYFGKPTNTSIDFTDMSIAEVLAWQSDYVKQGSPSSAVGRYQIINTTLSDLVRQLDINPSEKFDESMQDKMAITLIERRGAEAYVNNELTREEFAASLAKEWAALPKVVGKSPNDSFYASDGLNKSRVEVAEVLAVIGSIDT